MMPKSYYNLEIQVANLGNEYLATIQSPDGRRTQVRFANPFTEFELKYYIAEVTRGPESNRRGALEGPESAAKKLGGTLFRNLFADSVRYQLDTAIDRRKPDEGLRIRLDLDTAPELAALPWECLFYPERNLFLALSPDTSLVRYARAPEPIPPLQVEPPLRILAMACSPQDLPELRVDLEQQRLEASMGRLVKANLVKVDWLAENSLAALQRAVDTGQYHIFHFVGHGDFVEEQGRKQGVLMFEDETQSAQAVTGERLGWILRHGVRLAVINACEGARSEAGDPSTGVASNLLLHGIPAVVAMQFAISDPVAVQFAQNFYGGLAIGLPVDAAMNSARRSVLAAFNNSAEWATPVLFMRGLDGHIFDVAVLEPADAEAELIQRETIETAIRNLEIDWSQVGQWFGTKTNSVLDLVTGWTGVRVAGLPVRSQPPGAVEQMYQEALKYLEEERWSDANRRFKQINQISPGYADIARQWQYSVQQEQLAVIYRRLTENWAQRRWDKVLSACREILQITPEYKDTTRYYAEVCQILGSASASAPAADKPPPASLPGQTSGSAKPTTLPRSGQPAPKPSSLPSGSQKPRKPDKPPTLPG
jgi:hypothetical protein